jgi:hypothetical protein
MKKIFIFLILFFLWQLPGLSAAPDKVNLYFFYGDGCPHCAKEEKFLDKLEAANGNIRIFRYEVWHNRDNAQLLARLASELGLDVSGVPVLIVGDQTIVGYNNDQTTGEKIRSLVEKYVANGCNDIAAPILGKDGQGEVCVHGCAAGDGECLHNCGCSADNLGGSVQAPETVSVPFLGEINISRVSLPVLTILIGATDGFNPCAMWVLLFFISLLLGMENKRRMWILGSAFVLSSGAVYFLFLAAWLNFFLFLGFVFWIRAAVGAVALASGGYHLYDYYKNRDGGCEVTSGEKRRRVFDRLRAATGHKKFLAALGGVILLACAVNLVELVCSAGLPAVYTQILALADLPRWQHYGYLLLYILFYMIDDLFVFIIAMTTLRMKALSSRYTRWSGLVGGLLMLLIGVLLLFKPGWLMFG